MKKISEHLVTLLASAIIALVVYSLIHNTAQFTVQRIEVLGYFPSNATVSVSNIQRNGYVELLDEFEIVGSQQDELQRVGTTYLNNHIHKLQINIQQQSDAIVTLARIRFFFPYLETYYFTEDNISNYFSSPQSLPVIGRQYQGRSITITSNSNIAEPFRWLSIVLAGLFFIGSFCLLRNIQWSKLPAFADMSLSKQLSSTDEFNCINGIRGLAALLVLFSHTAPGYKGVGMGLSLLFVISGFLLTKPFVVDPQRIFSLNNVEEFIVKRIKRILPMYYVYVFVLFGVSFDVEGLIRHLVFLQGDGHLWPMTQIFVFYMLLPFILIGTSFARSIHRIGPPVLLIIACYFAVTTLGDWKPFYNGRFSQEFFLYAFLLGVLSAYIQFDWIARMPALSKKTLNVIGIFALSVTVLSILWSAPIRPNNYIGHWVSLFWVKAILASSIIVLSFNSFGSFSHKIMANTLFRSVGVIGFSFYLLHGLGMGIFTEIQMLYFADPSLAGERTWVFMLGSFCITYPLAVFTYSYIERPFFGKRFSR